MSSDAFSREAMIRLGLTHVTHRYMDPPASPRRTDVVHTVGLKMSASRLEIGKLLAWTYVTPVGAVWVIASFFPVIGLLEPDAGTRALMAEIFFLATGFIGLASLAFGLRLLVAPERRLDLPNPLKGKPAIIAIYTTVWLAAYAAFQMTA